MLQKIRAGETKSGSGEGVHRAAQLSLAVKTGGADE